MATDPVSDPAADSPTSDTMLARVVLAALGAVGIWVALSG